MYSQSAWSPSTRKSENSNFSSSSELKKRELENRDRENKNRRSSFDSNIKNKNKNNSRNNNLSDYYSSDSGGRKSEKKEKRKFDKTENKSIQKGDALLSLKERLKSKREKIKEENNNNNNNKLEEIIIIKNKLVELSTVKLEEAPILSINNKMNNTNESEKDAMQNVSTKKRRSGWSATPAVPSSTGFCSGPSESTSDALKTALGTVVAGDAALQTSRLHLLAQQMGFSPDQIKAARELYVGNLPPLIEVNQLVEFLNTALVCIGANVLPGPPGIKGWRASDGHFAFVEFRTMEEANNGLALNGVNCFGYNLRIGRPKTYPEHLLAIQAAQENTLLSSAGVSNGCLLGVDLSLLTPQAKQLLGAAFSEETSLLTTPTTSGSVMSSVQRESSSNLASSFGLITTTTNNSPPDRLALSNLPPLHFLSAERVEEMISAFGSIRYALTFEVSSPDGRDVSAVCFFQFENLTDQIEFKDCAEELGWLHNKSHGVVVLSKSDDLLATDLTIRDALIRTIKSKTKNKMKEMIVRSVEIPTRCLLLSNLLFDFELIDQNQLYSSILDDIKLECKDHGRVISIEIPKPKSVTSTNLIENNKNNNLVKMSNEEINQNEDLNQNSQKKKKPNCSAFVEFATVEECIEAKNVLNTYKYAGRKVRASFYSEKKYLKRDFSDPSPCYSPSESSLFTPSLASLVPSMLKQMNEIDKMGRELMRAAATAAANVTFSGGVQSMDGLMAIADSASTQAMASAKLVEQEMVLEDEAMDMD